MLCLFGLSKLDSAFSRFKRPLVRRDDEGCRLTLPDIEQGSIPGTSSIPLSNVSSFSISLHCNMAKMEDSTTPMAATLASRYILSTVRNAYCCNHFTDIQPQAQTSTGTHSGTSSPASHSPVLAASSKTTPKSPIRTSKSPQVGTNGCAALALLPLHYQNRSRMCSDNVI